MAPVRERRSRNLQVRAHEQAFLSVAGERAGMGLSSRQTRVASIPNAHTTNGKTKKPKDEREASRKVAASKHTQHVFSDFYTLDSHLDVARDAAATGRLVVRGGHRGSRSLVALQRPQLR